jgi:hypothetical protein
MPRAQFTLFQRFPRPSISVAIALWFVATATGQESDKQVTSRKNLKDIGIAFHNYHDVFGRFPTSTRDRDGKPLLSWRVEILPYVEAADLYNQFHLDQPWDSDHNRPLIAKMPDVFKAPSVNEAEKTVYLQPVGPEAIFPRDRSDPRKPREVARMTIGSEPRVLAFSVGVADVKDGLSNTILVVEADPKKAVTWTKPGDLEFDSKMPKAGLGGLYTGGFHALMGDASVHFIPLTAMDKDLRSLFHPADGNVIPDKLLK